MKVGGASMCANSGNFISGLLTACTVEPLVLGLGLGLAVEYPISKFRN